jgi:ABC-type transporter Mla MlaB component
MDAPATAVTVLAIHPPLRRADLDGLTARICRTLERERPRLVLCDVGGFDEVDAVTVDALARLQLAARRRGCQIRLRGASRALRDLVELMGLADVLPE